MAITVKKKTLKLKSDAPASTEAADEQPAAEEASVLATMRQPRADAPARSGGSFVPYFIMALVACILLGALLAVQFIENSYYTGMVP